MTQVIVAFTLDNKNHAYTFPLPNTKTFDKEYDKFANKIESLNLGTSIFFLSGEMVNSITLDDVAKKFPIIKNRTEYRDMNKFFNKVLELKSKNDIKNPNKK